MNEYETKTDANDPRYWRGKLMTARRMGNDVEAERALRNVVVLRVLRELAKARDSISSIDVDHPAVGQIRVAMNELELRRDPR